LQRILINNMILEFKEQEKLLSDYGIKRPPTFLAKEREEAVELAGKVGYPLVMKVFSTKILHRTEISGVVTGLKGEEEVREAFSRLIKIQDVEAVIVQKEISGVELFIGAKKDPTFGATLMLGTGGTMVELFNDVVFRIAPIEEKDALEMISEIKGKVLLEGFRGRPKIRKEKLVDVLVKTSELIYKEKIKELDFNPVIATDEEVFICDVKLFHD